MMKTTAHTAPAGTPAVRRRKLRPRKLPKWLESTPEAHALARRRCLLILQVLSGETPVTAAIAAAKLSRGTYYQLETRALEGMLAALNPLAPGKNAPAAAVSAASARIAQLERQVRQLEQHKRRSERLLWLTRKSLRGPLTSGHRGRWPSCSPRRSSPAGASGSPNSSAKSGPAGTASPRAS